MVDNSNIIQIKLTQYSLFFNLGVAFFAAGLVVLGIYLSLVAINTNVQFGIVSSSASAISILMSHYNSSNTILSNSIAVATNSILTNATASINSINIKAQIAEKFTMYFGIALSILGSVCMFASILYTYRLRLENE